MPTFRFNYPYARSYSPPSKIGRALPGEVREFDKCPDHFWSEVTDETNAEKERGIASTGRRARRGVEDNEVATEPDAPAVTTEPEVPATFEEEAS